MKRRGFKIFPVDHDYNVHKTAVATISMNLQDGQSQSTVESMLETVKPAGIHLGLPCGTCSRARDKPLPAHLKGHFHDPPPLRDAFNLLGFDNLTGTQAAKVQAANALYAWGVRILYKCFLLNINVSIENPERSCLWGVLTLMVKQYNDAAFLQWFENLDRVDFHTCMHGGTRAKRTRLLSTKGLYTKLAVACDQQHDHEPWRISRVGTGLQYDTALEAEYPKLLCDRMADLLAQHVGLPLPPADLSQTRASRRTLGQHVKQAPPLVPEFAQILEVDHPPNHPSHRLLSSHEQGEQSEMVTEVGTDQNKKLKRTFRIGVQQEPDHFLSAAKAVQHPMSPQKVLPDVLKAAIFDNLTMDPVQLAKNRMRAVMTVNSMAKELELQEKQIKQQCSASVRKVLTSKRIALWEALLKGSNFLDMEIVDIVKRGADLTGEPKPSPLFPTDWKPATIADSELLSSSLWRSKALQSNAFQEGGEDDSTSLHEATLEEVKLGHLEGPFSEQQLDEKFGRNGWLFNKRFALKQGTAENPKVRVIDDCRRSGLNSAYTTTNKLQLLDVDVLACALLAIARSHETGYVELGVDGTNQLNGPMDVEARRQKWWGRTLDLSKAYKQVPLSEGAQPLCVLGYFHEGSWKYYTTSRLPFGATSAVYTFNRISRSIHHILCSYLSVVCTCFYDDFPALSTQFAASLVTKSMSLLLNLLGWEHAQVGIKATDFAEEFSALGITVKLQKLHLGSFTLSNKEGRIPRIVEMLQKVRKQGRISRIEAAEIQGHLNFAQSFFTSKSLRFALGQFDALSKMQGGHAATRLNQLCQLTEAILLSLPPREFHASAMDRPFCLFTDGAWEDGVATAGLVLFDPDKDETIVREIEIPGGLVSLWLKDVGQQLICQIEFFAYLCARFEYREVFTNRGVIAWLDNEAARFAASKGTAAAPSLVAMCRVIQQMEVIHPTVMWVERVSSYSNPSDKPSRRMCTAAAQLLGALHVEEPAKLTMEIIQAIVTLTGDNFAVIPDLYPKR